MSEYEFTDEEEMTSSGFRELLAVQKTLQDSPDQFADTGVVWCIGKRFEELL